ncbi:MAG: hypothetical protein Kapaf2KO_12450 [Candidatus Kapaibacteriales bacterium]
MSAKNEKSLLNVYILICIIGAAIAFIIITKIDNDVPNEYIEYFNTPINSILVYKNRNKSGFIFITSKQRNNMEVFLPVCIDCRNTFFFEYDNIFIGDSLYKEANNDTLFIYTVDKKLKIMSGYSSDFYK